MATFYVLPPNVETVEATDAQEAAAIVARLRNMDSGPVTLAESVRTFDVTSDRSWSATERTS